MLFAPRTTDVAAIAPAVERCAQKLGGLDGLALNVGISSGDRKSVV